MPLKVSKNGNIFFGIAGDCCRRWWWDRRKLLLAAVVVVGGGDGCQKLSLAVVGGGYRWRRWWPLLWIDNIGNPMDNRVKTHIYSFFYWSLLDELFKTQLSYWVLNG